MQFKLDKKHLVLKEVFILETIVQVVEAVMYVWLIFAVKKFDTMVQRRYIDWMITTPIMLINTIVFMEYVNSLNNNKIITFTGNEKNNKLSKLGDINFWVNSKAYNHIENVHQVLLLSLVDLIIGKTEYPPN